MEQPEQPAEKPQEQQQHEQPQGRSLSHPPLHTEIPSSNLTQRTAHSTPMSSPSLFSPSNPRPRMAVPAHAATEANTPVATESNSPFLHPLQNRKVRETHRAVMDIDVYTGRKLINQYEVIEEIGRGVHGKVKRAKNGTTGETVAIKIIPRFSKKRRLGRVTAIAPQDKTKKEIAILKKIRHPNVVALLEVIDDPELKKIYMVLEHVELGEVVWRKKGLPHISAYERRRVEKEMRGEIPTVDEERYAEMLERRQAIKDHKRAKMTQQHAGPTDFWSIEYGAADDDALEMRSVDPRSRASSRDDLAGLERIPGSMPSSLAASRATSRAPSRTQSVKSMGQAVAAAMKADVEAEAAVPESTGDIDTPGPLRSNANSAAALEGTMFGPYAEDPTFRGRSPSMADSIISHMSSVDYGSLATDPFADDYSYVPCFTMDQARSTFRDTVLGLEYLHYQGVVHRDIKPANLLWTKDYRVKISDFGVSYFGRPIRDGEPNEDETMSESEAQDFDDDLELSKTVGTPAFFAPELCYTDLDREQPKISEQIDVWSLGVTLYCLIFARIPFMAEDEWQMFRKIATEDVYIPRKRLRPVDPSTNPDGTSLYKRQNRAPYRDDNDLEYEDIDNLLYDLLRQMLIKNPEKRIRLRDIKRHPWVVQGIPNLIGWLDDTDPARPSSGRRIQVDEREMSHAVVPITFLERARSTFKRTVGKLMHPLGGQAVDPRARRRATSSAASSSGEVPPTPHPRDARRRSLRGDDYFAGITSDEVSNYSPIASPYESSGSNPMATAILNPIVVGGQFLKAKDAEADKTPQQVPMPLTAEPDALPSPQPLRPFQRHSQTRSMGQGFLPLTPSLPEAKTMPATPSFDGLSEDPCNALRKARDMHATDDATRSRSVDRGLFNSVDKHSHPKVSLSTVIAPGSIERPKHPRPARSIDLSKARAAGNVSGSLPSPLMFSSQAVAGYQHAHPNSDPNIHKRLSAELEERPRTAHRIETVSLTAPSKELYRALTPEFSNAEVPRRPGLERDFALRGRESPRSNAELDPAGVPCPPSPENAMFADPPPAPSRGDTMTTMKSSSQTSFGGLDTPLTSPSELTSPISAADITSTKPDSQQMLAFQSDPSLPALLSGASSVSNDLESELLGQPGIVHTRPALLETTDSLTPPAMDKEAIAGFPLDQALEASTSMDTGVIPLQFGAQPAPRNVTPASARSSRIMDDDDEDSGSDEGLQMMKTTRKKKAAESHSSSGHRTLFTARRRDTNASIASTETAKKVAMHDYEQPSPSQAEH